MTGSRWLLVLFLVTVVSGCTNSRWLLSAVYNRMDNILATEVKEYADFSKEQSRQIDLMADQYHLWHRTQHLPQYASLLREVDTQLQLGETVGRDQIETWSMQIEGLAREMGDCHPLNNAYEFLRSLTEEQVEQVLAHGVKEHEEFVEDRIDKTREKRLEMRYKETRTWFGRFQLDLNSEQREQLKAAIAAERGFGDAGINLWKNWHEEFVEILRGRHDQDFENRVDTQLAKLWTLQDDNFPEVVDFNRTLWIDYFAELAESQTEDQRQRFSRWLVKMASNLDSIAMDVSAKEQNMLAQEGGNSCLAPTMSVSSVHISK